MSVRIVNIIATGRIKGSIDIESLSNKLQYAQYHPETFCGLIYRRNKLPTNILFESGKISSHGAKTEKAAKQSILDIVEKIKDLNCIVGSAQVETIRIENVVGTTDLGHKIDLEGIAENLDTAMYEPEQFPGLFLRPFHNSIVCLVFASGKIVLVGGKSKEQTIEAYKSVKEMLRNWLLS